MDKNKLLIVFILRIVISGLFILSGIAKLYPIFAFEKQLVDLGVASWASAPYLSRAIIGFELFLGLSFLQSNYLKKYIIPATVLLLVAFCVHLSITIYNEGASSGNCGCFGQMIPMTPLQALIKNVITLGLLGYIYYLYREKEKNSFSILANIGLATYLALFIAFPVNPYNTASATESVVKIDTLLQNNVVVPGDTIKKDSTAIVQNTNPNLIKNNAIVTNVTPANTNTNTAVTQTTNIVPAPIPGPSQATSMYAPFKNFSDGIPVNLDEGKKIVTLFSLDCEHCMETAKKIGELGKKIKLPPTYFLFWGTQDQVENFFTVAQCRFPYKILEPGVFFPLLGNAPAPPRVSYLHNGNIVGDYDFNSFSIEKLEEAIKK